jgi:hypothetical protein
MAGHTKKFGKGYANKAGDFVYQQEEENTINAY